MIIDPPQWMVILLDVGSGALIAGALYLFFVWRDRRKPPRP